MPKFSKTSLDKLNTCHPDLQKIFNEVIKHFDCTILCGHRNEEEQNIAYKAGVSKLKYPKSKHNKTPSLAVDVAPYPIDWGNRRRFYYFAGIVKGVALSIGIKLRWGGDWDGDNDINDQKFFDLPHWEIKEQNK